MDKSAPQQLDPKLKEAYDRVMGTVVNPPTPQQSPAHQEPIPTTPVMPAAPVHAAIHHEETKIEVQSPTTSPVKLPKKKGKISPLIIILGLIVFLAVYAIVWIKFFNINVPYLNPIP
jgi:hypothetical protein